MSDIIHGYIHWRSANQRTLFLYRSTNHKTLDQMSGKQRSADIRNVKEIM